MNKIILPLMLIVLLITGCGEVTETKKLVIGIDDEFAPMGFRDEQGDIVGFDVDLAKEAARRMNATVEFKTVDWYNKETEITSGNIDMIWNGCDIREKYKAYMTFSRPYMDNRQILMVRKGNDKQIYTLNDLEGKVIGTQAGSNSEDYINDNKKVKDSFAAFKTYHDIKDEFAALGNGECDVLIIDEIAGRYEMIRHPGTVELVDVTIGAVTEFGIGFRKDNVELRDKVQEVFDTMIADGTAQKISKQWFQADLIKVRR